MIDKDEFKQKINNVCENIKTNDVTNATTELLKIIDDYNQGFDELNTLSNEKLNLAQMNEDLNSKINSLKDVNMDLLLRVGTPKTNENTNTGNEDNTPHEKLKFENLFNEKGELK